MSSNLQRVTLPKTNKEPKKTYVAQVIGKYYVAKSTGVVQYTDCITAEGQYPPTHTQGVSWL